MSQIFAIIPAAGRSTRMGADKALVDVGGRTMIEGVVGPLVAAGIERIVVVTTTEIAAKLPEGVRQRIQVAINDDSTSEMIDSVRIGLRAIAAAHELAPEDGILICPGDHPGIATSDMARCLEAFRVDSSRIVIGSLDGKRGHPMIFPASLAVMVHSPACDGGLNRLASLHADRVALTPCESSGVLHDLDTPGDVDHARRAGLDG